MSQLYRTCPACGGSGLLRLEGAEETRHCPRCVARRVVPAGEGCEAALRAVLDAAGPPTVPPDPLAVALAAARAALGRGRG
jgi:hypothetical protein